MDHIQGGKVIGESGCIINVMQIITGIQQEKITTEYIGSHTESIINRSNMIIIVKFDDGSVEDQIISTREL